MAQFDVAHVRQQGVDLIIVPLNNDFGRKAPAEQEDAIAGLQQCAASAGLRGTVVPVWIEGSSMRFIAPRPWHPFFQSLSWAVVRANINRRLTCG
jgi:hypothetical protein